MEMQVHPMASRPSLRVSPQGFPRRARMRDWPDAREIQILSDIRERPYLEALGKVKKILLDRAVNKVHVSLSHSGDYATAMVILES